MLQNLSHLRFFQENDKINYCFDISEAPKVLKLQKSHGWKKIKFDSWKTTKLHLMSNSSSEVSWENLKFSTT